MSEFIEEGGLVRPASYVNLGNARNEEQRAVMEAIAEHGECPFCPEHLAESHKQPILRTGEHWLITPNQWPYPHTRTHLLAIATYHAESLDDLQPGAGEELFDHLRWATKEYAIQAGGIAMRYGNIEANGATIRHLHAHFIEADPDRPADAKVKFKIS